jgi:hypothetical protein
MGMTAMARTSNNCKRQGRMFYNDYNQKRSVEKKVPVVSLKGLVAKTHSLAVNRLSLSNSDPGSAFKGLVNSN